MTTSNPKLVVFDLDGTLNMTERFVLPAFETACREFGLPAFSKQQVMSIVGGRPEDYSKILFPEASPEFRERFFRREGELELLFMEKDSSPFPGIPEALTELRHMGYLTAVCSNAFPPYINSVLERLKLSGLIQEVQSLIPGKTKNDTLGVLIARTNPSKAVMVGDRIFDLEAAKANAIPFIGCLYGYGYGEMVGADCAISAPVELVDAVRELIGTP